MTPSDLQYTGLLSPASETVCPMPMNVIIQRVETAASVSDCVNINDWELVKSEPERMWKEVVEV
jgi:hypothetical protein